MVGSLLLAFIVVIVAAQLGGAVSDRLGQPPVLGELAAGICIGSLPLLGFGGLDFIAHDRTIEALAEIGVVLLLFEVGLATRVSGLIGVWRSSFLAAVFGVGCSMGLGWLVGKWLLPGSHPYVPLFLGATLAATSVGISARVLKDLDQVASPEGQIILGAAVIDDVLGLLVLAVIVALMSGTAGPDNGGRIALIVLKGGGFVVGALVLGRWLAPRVLRLVVRSRGQGAVVPAAVVGCFAFAWLAARAGLAPLVGAFVAGLALQGRFEEVLPGGRTIQDSLFPISSLLVPVFFFRMGLLVDLRQILGGSILLTLALTTAAVIGKQACALGVVHPGIDKLAVGLGMIPRGEVELIFAGMGVTLVANGHPLFGPREFAAVVATVLLTTVMTPPLLRWRVTRTAAKPKKVAEL